MPLRKFVNQRIFTIDTFLRLNLDKKFLLISYKIKII